MPVVLATELKKLFIKSDVAGCMTHNFFSLNTMVLIVCHSSGPQILENNVKTKRDQARKTGRVQYVCNVSQQSPGLSVDLAGNNTDRT